MRAWAVIGANYGDEGKGRVVDWLAARCQAPAIVVRSNGGAQAGHTVKVGALRHVFHHFGSGTFRNAATHLSRYMVSHPILWGEERAKLASIGLRPRITADGRGFVTTPWDMMVNQAAEMARGTGRHGSCGMGFGETVGRAEETGFRLTVADLFETGLDTKLRAIRDEWLPWRAAALGLDVSAAALAHAGDAAVLNRFARECRKFAAGMVPQSDATLGSAGASLIFEGAQGLLLDQQGAGFPHVTRSNTGMTNVTAIAAEAGLRDVRPVYVTRAYLTRHGRGPMLDERSIDEWYAVDDPTNRPNPWQETLRYGLLDPKLLGARIAADFRSAPLAREPSIAVTCLDQARHLQALLDGDALQTCSAAALANAIETGTGLSVAATFNTPANDPLPLATSGCSMSGRSSQ